MLLLEDNPYWFSKSSIAVLHFRPHHTMMLLILSMIVHGVVISFFISLPKL